MRRGLFSVLLVLMMGALADAAPPASRPVVDFLGWQGGVSADYWQQRRELIRNLDQAAPDQEADRRLDLARFYLAHDDAPEALGVLSAFGGDSEVSTAVVLFRGIAEMMLGHAQRALGHLTNPRLIRSDHARLWRGLAHADQRDWPAARDQWPAYGTVDKHYSRPWQGRFVAARVNTALGVGDLDMAGDLLDPGAGSAAERLDPRLYRLFQGRLGEARDDVNIALADYAKAADQSDSPVAAEARFRFLVLQLSAGQVGAALIRSQLGDLYPMIQATPVAFEYHSLAARLAEEAGEPFAALFELRLARDRAQALRYRIVAETEIDRVMMLSLGPAATAAKGLIGRARGFYQMQDLLPPGYAGDQIVLAHAGRLAALDLLGPAEELLAHQVAKRLRGTSRARAALQLAEIRLALGRPSLARLSAGIAGHRRLGHNHQIHLRLVQARSLAEIGDLPGALAMLDGLDWDPALKLSADLLLRQGKGGQAETAYRRLLTNLRTRGPAGDQDRPLSRALIERRLALASAIAGAAASDAPPALVFIARQPALPQKPASAGIDAYAGLDALSAVIKDW